MAQKVTRLLEELGPMTAQDIARELGIRIETARGMCGKAKHAGQIRIVTWRRDEDSGRLYPRAVYAAGSGKNAPKPKPLTRYDYNRRHRTRKRLAVASVWELAKPVDFRRIGS